MNTEHERSIEFQIFIYHKSTMTHRRWDTIDMSLICQVLIVESRQGKF